MDKRNAGKKAPQGKEVKFNNDQLGENSSETSGDNYKNKGSNATKKRK